MAAEPNSENTEVYSLFSKFRCLAKSRVDKREELADTFEKIRDLVGEGIKVTE